MKQIFKHPRKIVTGLAAVGIAPALRPLHRQIRNRFRRN